MGRLPPGSTRKEWTLDAHLDQVHLDLASGFLHELQEELGAGIGVRVRGDETSGRPRPDRRVRPVVRLTV